jgi:hypothetical protein
MTCKYAEQASSSSCHFYYLLVVHAFDWFHFLTALSAEVMTVGNIQVFIKGSSTRSRSIQLAMKIQNIEKDYYVFNAFLHSLNYCFKVQFEVLRAVAMKSTIFNWLNSVLTDPSPLNYPRVGAQLLSLTVPHSPSFLLCGPLVEHRSFLLLPLWLGASKLNWCLLTMMERLVRKGSIGDR